jgi:hypothetical protein
MTTGEPATREVARESLAETRGRESTRLLTRVFIILFAQLILLILISFAQRFGPVLLFPNFSVDFAEFYQAATDWLAHVDPYLRLRLVAPPSTILLGMALHWLPFQVAARVAFFGNAVMVLFGLRIVARHSGLNRTNELLLYGIATLFYPFYFLAERGNIDGFMLVLLAGAFAAKDRLSRAILLGASFAVKVYSGLLVVVLIRKRNFRLPLMAVAVALLLQVPFFNLLPSFMHAVFSRSTEWRLAENLSPSVLFNVVLGEGGPWKKLYIAAWLLTLAYRLWKDRDRDLETLWAEYVPWMIAFPSLVFIYSGVLALPLLAKVAADCQHRPATRGERLILMGFLLLGFSEPGWFINSLNLTPAAGVLHLVCPLGTCLLVAGSCLLAGECRESHPAAA